MNRNIRHPSAAFAAAFLLLAPCASLRAADSATPTNAPVATVVTNAPADKVERAASAYGRLTLGASFGDDLSVYGAEAMLPLVDADRTALLLNPRGLLLEDDEQELGLGLVLRRLSAEKTCILGINAFYDARFTDADNTLEQVGAGLELLSRRIDARINYALPISGEKSLGPGVCPLNGSPIPCSGIEEAMEGFDAELGVWLPYLDRHLPTGVFVGYHRYESDMTSDTVDGMKARVEIRPCANVTLDAEWFEDSGYRDSETVVGVRVQVPFDFWNGLKMERGGGRLPAFPTRMTEPVQRDFRVRTLITRPSAPAVSAPIATIPKRTKKPDEPPPPAPVCRTYPALDDNGDVVFVTICE